MVLGCLWSPQLTRLVMELEHSSRSLFQMVLKHKTIAKISRTLTPAKKNYGKPEKEALGVRKGVPAHSANRLQQWTIKLMGSDCYISYQRTKDLAKLIVYLASSTFSARKMNKQWLHSCRLKEICSTY
ncbi:unnamed protein product [Hymenolepis diminuta]|uniref:Reverse transcriptase RNase H-like domain-containing protein n=1 Tax=Hymenolepis diminuta TaxID=6216 RepID=A0A564ZBS5_HYMDI|nr:unnamed protein product [Hymenolepis diminuta]